MKKEYATFSAVDFAKDADFLKWVKYPKENPELMRSWEKFIQSHPYKKDEIEDARQLIFAILEEKYIPTDEKQREVWNRIKQTLEDNKSTLWPAKREETLWKFWIAKAAMVLIVVTASFFTWRFFEQKPSEVESIATVKTEALEIQKSDVDKTKTIILTDGTAVILQPLSSIQYPKVFKKHLREVYLTGEAFFEVKKDATRPFLVHANEIVTRVLGTSFTVRNFNNENVLVQVKTGKVSVFKERDHLARKKSPNETVEGVVLTPNQQVVYERDQMRLTKSLVENPAILLPAAKYDFEFSDTPIREVFDAIEKAYGVDIVYDEEILSNCYLNASLSDVPLHDKLKLISKGINTTYEMIDSHIIIYGQGCK